MNRDPVASVAWDDLADLFESARALHGAAREQYLHSACGENRALATELRSLLAAAEQVTEEWRALSQQQLEPLIYAAAMDGPPSGPEAEADARPSYTGTTVRHYTVGAPIGRGGTGVVYRGRDTRLQREVALKFLSATHVPSAESRTRLEREARAVSSLDDPHICALHAIEETEQGVLCLVMAFCAGGTLRERLRSGALDVTSALQIGRDLAAGLSSAHQRRIVHGDLKPANVGFTHDGVTKILDFGLAVRVGEDGLASRDSRIGFAGTLPYAAPELLRGGMPDVRTDLWALGVVLYEMLIGQRPFVGLEEADLVTHILESSPALLVRSDGQVISPQVQALVLSLLAKDPSKRPKSAQQVLTALQSAMTASPAMSVPDARASSGGWLSDWRTGWRRGVFRVTAVAAVVAVTALGVEAVRSVARSAAEASAAATPPVALPVALPTLAVLPFTVRGDDELAHLREGMVDLLTPAFDATGLVRGIDPNAVIGAAQQRDAAAIDSASSGRLARDLGAARYVVGSVVQTGDRITLRATLYRADGQDAARARVEVESVDGILQGGESLVRQLMTAELREPGDTDGAIAATSTSSIVALRAFLDGERALRDARPSAAVAHFSAAVQADSLFALAWYRLARAAHWGDVDSLSREAAARASALEASLPFRLQQVVRSYRALKFGAPLAAERGFRQIVSDYPTDVDAWMLLGETLFENYPLQGRSAGEATAAFQRVMELDPRHREITVYLMELAARSGEHGKLDTLFSMYFSPNSAGEQPGIRETFLALHARRVRGVQRSIVDPSSAQTALRRIGSYPVDRLAARELALTLTGGSVAPALRLEGWLALASLDAAAARPGDAERSWRQAQRVDPALTMLHRAMTMSAPGSPFSPDSIRALRQMLESTPLGALSGMAAFNERETLRRYASGLLSARLDDTAGVRRARDLLSGAVAADQLARPLREALDAQLLVRRGDWDGALTALRASDLALPAPLRRRVPLLAQFAERRLQAVVLRALGRGDEAAQWDAGLRAEPGVWALPYLTGTSR